MCGRKGRRDLKNPTSGEVERREERRGEELSRPEERVTKVDGHKSGWYGRKERS